MIKYCRVCGDELNDDNWYPSYRKRGNYICKKCCKEQLCLWRKDNPEKVRLQITKDSRKQGHLPMSENKECAQFLGIHIAERILRNSFKDVEMMPYGNPGYDFVCNKGMLVDGKSSCLGKNGRWMFSIKRNTTADYFICLAFDNRMNLNTLHAWLIPGEKLNHLTGAVISPSTINKWKKYECDITKISACCDTMKNGGD